MRTFNRRQRPIAWRFEGDCIRCTSHAQDSYGYPRTKRNDKMVKIARRIAIRRHGALSSSIVCRHTCDHTWCINPAHILTGTHGDNVHDALTRGRHRSGCGERHGMSKITNAEVRAIRASAEKQRALATRYGISQAEISHIKTGKWWRHVK